MNEALLAQDKGNFNQPPSFEMTPIHLPIIKAQDESRLLTGRGNASP